MPKSLQNDQFFPLISELPYNDPAATFSTFAKQPWSVLFDSADSKQSKLNYNRYSYIAISPFKRFLLVKNKLFIDDELTEYSDIFMLLKKYSTQYQLISHKNYPPFQGGMMGLLSYDLNQLYEHIPICKITNMNIPILAIGFYDLVHAFDHYEEKSWLFSSGLPKLVPSEREKHCRIRQQFYLDSIMQEKSQTKILSMNKTKLDIKRNFDQIDYMKAIKQAIEYIKSGDIFEVNLAQRFAVKLPNNFDSFHLYKALKRINPSPFSGYANYGVSQIISSSPERFLSVKDGIVETRPIKGTRKRSSDADKDKLLADDLISSEKDRAENIMIVDLMRNDLSIVCDPNSVEVEKLCGHEIFPQVHHLVSVIKGKLKQGLNIFDLLKSTFPGGSITGAPKIRAMQIIAELEPHQRGPYCGSFFWASFDGLSMDSSILIRTFLLHHNELSFQGGGAITIDSDPETEYEETLSKVKALKEALELIYY